MPREMPCNLCRIPLPRRLALPPWSKRPLHGFALCDLAPFDHLTLDQRRAVDLAMFIPPPACPRIVDDDPVE